MTVGPLVEVTEGERGEGQGLHVTRRATALEAAEQGAGGHRQRAAHDIDGDRGAGDVDHDHHSAKEGRVGEVQEHQCIQRVTTLAGRENVVAKGPHQGGGGRLCARGTPHHA